MMRLFTRNCPRDGSPLDERRVPAFDLRIDECGRCYGVFVDAEGLARLAGDRTIEPILPRVDFFAPDRAACPACGGGMAPRRAGDVVVDGCGACGSVWLEADVLRALSRAGHVQPAGRHGQILHQGLAGFSQVIGRA